MFILICLNVVAGRANDLFGSAACIGFVCQEGRGKGSREVKGELALAGFRFICINEIDILGSC